jgi:hypothetical protein
MQDGDTTIEKQEPQTVSETDRAMIASAFAEVEAATRQLETAEAIYGFASAHLAKVYGLNGGDGVNPHTGEIVRAPAPVDPTLSPEAVHAALIESDRLAHVDAILDEAAARVEESNGSKPALVE